MIYMTLKFLYVSLVIGDRMLLKKCISVFHCDPILFFNA